MTIVVLNTDPVIRIPVQRMLDRASPTQAAAALLLGARAYLPLDLPPDRTAAALRHATQGRLHLEPEADASAARAVRRRLRRGLADS
jgi:DNA-binding NarL/FixJ family response regulator